MFAVSNINRNVSFRIQPFSSEIQAENFSAKRSDLRVIVRRFLLLVRQSETDAKRDRISLLLVGVASPFGFINLDRCKLHFLINPTVCSKTQGTFHLYGILRTLRWQNFSMRRICLVAEDLSS